MSGSMSRSYRQTDDNRDTLGQVIEALIETGIESTNLILGIDFTKSNEWAGATSFNNMSLHHIGEVSNPYEVAVTVIGGILSSLNSEDNNLIPCFGFGDESTQDKDVFSFYPDQRSCNGIEEALERYRELVPRVRLAGPTSFAPIIETAIDVVEKSGRRYHVLLIIANSQVTRSLDTETGQLSQHERETIDAIVKASEYPLSIVLVGVGDGPWKMMEFGNNIPHRKFDNFQFVNLTEILRRDIPVEKMHSEIALAALKEIPSQYLAAFELRRSGYNCLAEWKCLTLSFEKNVNVRCPFLAADPQTRGRGVHYLLLSINNQVMIMQILLLLRILAFQRTHMMRSSVLYALRILGISFSGVDIGHAEDVEPSCRSVPSVELK